MLQLSNKNRIFAEKFSVWQENYILWAFRHLSESEEKTNSISTTPFW